MKKLTNANIDSASDVVTEFLTNEGICPKEVLRARLSVEEILLRYMSHLGERGSFRIHPVKKFRSLRIELQVFGESIDPFSRDEDTPYEILDSLLSNYGLAPAWKYKNGKNLISFPVRKEKKLSQVKQMGIAILSSLVLSMLCKMLPGSVSDFIVADLVAPAFQTFMGLLSAIAGPIVFLSVVWGICGIGDMATFGKIGRKLIGTFLSLSFLIGILGTILCVLFFELSDTGTISFSFDDLYHMILDIIPRNFVSPFVEGNSMQIIFMAFLFGLAMLYLNSRIPTVITIIDQMNMIMQTIMSAVSSLIPFFVFSSVLTMAVGNNMAIIARSYKLILVLFLQAFLLMATYLLLVSFRKKVHPLLLLKKLTPAFLIGLATASCVAAFQTNVTVCETELGVNKKVVDIGVPLGQVIFMPGAILVHLCASFGMAEAFGVPITPVWSLTAMIISVVLAIAAPPVPGAALTCFTILFLQLNIPVNAVAVIIALNVILEFFATGINLFCLQSQLVEISGSLGYLDADHLRK